MSILLESQESSSPVITRAVAKGLIGESSDNYNFSKIEQLGLRLLGCFPKEAAEWFVPRATSSKAFSQKDAEQLTTNDLLDNRINDYAAINGKFPSITVGVGMGGTTAHLALALGGPFLPQAFVVTLKHGTMNGNVNEYFTLTDKTAKTVTENNLDLMTIQHYDPIHDGWLDKRLNHLRVKLIALPDKYKIFLREKLLPGGDVVYLEGKAQWKRFRTGERNTFQVGGWGDIGPDEYLYGSRRLSDFAKKEKLDFSQWVLDGYPLEDGPESEWGSESGLGEALKIFCEKEGFNFINISYENPNHFSKLAYYAKYETLKRAGIPPEGVVVEMFSQFDTSIIDHSALLPLWLIFNTMDSKNFLKSMIEEFPKDVPVFFSGLSTFSNTPDLVPWSEWEDVLSGFNMINIGARKSHYPADTLALLDWKKPLLKWAKAHQNDIKYQISGSDLLKIAKKVK
jgi:hypothetical protein